MIKKLRLRFITLAMLSLFLVLFLLIGSINLLNYRNIVNSADSVLEILAQNDGFFPRDIKRDDKTNHMSPETPYETRYFSVTLTDATISSIDTGKIAAIDSAAAKDYALRVLASDNDSGFLDNYRYTKKSQGINETIQIIFLDCGRSLDTFHAFLWTSIGISLFGMLAVLALLLLFSSHITRPVSESYEKQKRFITDAGHELKTPLAIIHADTDVLELEQGENEWISDIRQQTIRLSSLTNDLIYLSRMDETKQSISVSAFSLSDMAAEMLFSFQTLAKANQKSLSSEIAPNLFYTGNEKSLRQLFSILLDNAVKYTNENGQITLTLKKQGRFIILSVFNTTNEISQENVQHLFDRFYRTDASRNSATGGYGLGLSIAHAIVNTHKGKIAAHTQDGHSLSITVKLPC